MNADSRGRIRVVDSHTGGEPTRVVIDGGPDLGAGDLRSRLAVFRQRFDEFRTAVVGEPRGSDALVGALVVPPADPSCACGVIFFNNVGYLGMCVHGTIGLTVTLAHLGRIGLGEQRIETPVGIVTVTLVNEHQVTVRNVASFCTQRNVRVPVKDYGPVTGDVAWGGNWFFLVRDTAEEIRLTNVERLTLVTWRIRQALAEQRITGTEGAEIDHVELSGPPLAPGADSKNFVLCPGGAYDRSPCGTGTSAKIACLVSAGTLRPDRCGGKRGLPAACSRALPRSMRGQSFPTSRAQPTSTPWQR